MPFSQPKLARIPLTVIGLLCFNPALAAQDAFTRDEMLDLLRERDRAIIELQNTVRALATRLETAEPSVEPQAAREALSPTPSVGGSSSTFVPRQQDTLTVDEQAAERALERTLTQGGALLLPAWRLEFGLSGTATVNQRDSPAFFTVDNTTLLGSNDFETRAFSSRLDVRLGLPFDSQVEVGRPYDWVEQETSGRVLGTPFGGSTRERRRGPGSVRVGLAKTIFRERGGRPDLIGRIGWTSGSVDQTDGETLFQGGHESASAALTFIKRYDPLVFFGSGSYRVALEENGVQPGDHYSVSLGTGLAVTPTSSLFASIGHELITGARRNGDRIHGTSLRAVTLNLGASTLVARNLLLNVTTGIGVSQNAPDYTIAFSTSIQVNTLRRMILAR